MLPWWVADDWDEEKKEEGRGWQWVDCACVYGVSGWRTGWLCLASLDVARCEYGADDAVAAAVCLFRILHFFVCWRGCLVFVVVSA